jgi:hypothetical protein
MRFSLLLLAFPLLALPVQAQTTSTAKATHHHRIGWEQRFTQANTTHDGHLTMDQAKAGDSSVARHFTVMDKDNKGYVTEDDIRAYYRAQHASHHQSASSKSTPKT